MGTTNNPLPADLRDEENQLARVRGRTSFAPCAITPKQQEAITLGTAYLMWQQPFFSCLLIDQMRIVYTRGVPIAATDGKSIFLNPDTYCLMKVNERGFVLAHEVAHAVFDHPRLGWRLSQAGRVLYADGEILPYNHELMNQAMDYVINAMLIKSNVGAMPKMVNIMGKMEQVGLCDPFIATGVESTIDVYRSLYRQQPPPPPGKGKGKGKDRGQGQGSSNSQSDPDEGEGEGQGEGEGDHGGFDRHLKPGEGSGQTPAQAEREHNDMTWRHAVAAAAQTARTMGKMPAGMERLVDDYLEPPVDWREFIEGFLSRTLGGGGYTWERGDRRFLVRRPDPIYVPARSGHGCGTVVVAVDTSGSIGERELTLFFGCLSGILSDCKPQRIVVMWADAAVGRVDEVEDAMDLDVLRRKGAVGGGGTDFRPVFDEVEEMGLSPDALVYLTDMHGTFPDMAPRYPVIWAKITDVEAPWGEQLRLPDDVFGKR